MSDVTAKLQAKIDEVKQQCAEEVRQVEARYGHQVELLEGTIRLFNGEDLLDASNEEEPLPKKKSTSPRPKAKAKSSAAPKNEAAPKKQKAAKTTNPAGVTKRAAIEEAIRAVEGNFTRAEIAAYLNDHFPDLAQDISTPLIANTLLNLKGKLVECVKESSGGTPSTYRRLSRPTK